MKSEDQCILIAHGNDKNIYYFPESGVIERNLTTPVARPILNPDIRNIENVPSSIKRLTIKLTGNCNMKCEYCFTNFHPSVGSIEQSVYQVAINSFVATLSKGDHVAIIITGGEPLLYKHKVLDVLQLSMKLCSLKGCMCQFLIYTNGTLIDNDLIEAFKEYDVSLAISIDGPFDKHDNNRPMKSGTSSYASIVSNLIKLYSNGIHVEARTVIQPFESDIIGLIQHNISLGFSQMHLLPVYGHKTNQIENVTAWTNALSYYVNMLKSGSRIEIVPFFHLFRKMMFPEYFITSFFPCDAGKHKLCVSNDGNYYLCSHFAGAPYSSLSNVAETYPTDVQITTMLKQMQNPSCSCCWARRLCGGACYHRTFLGKAPNSSSDCDGWIEIIKLAIVLYCNELQDSPEVLQFFKDYRPMLSDEQKNAAYSYLQKTESGGK